jgi:heme exporter protein A
MNAMLSAADLSCIRGQRALFRGVGFTVAPGRWLHVRGANGAGKTSLLRILAGLSPADSGEIRWQGEPIAGDLARWHGDMLFLGHLPAVKDERTPIENLRAANELDGQPLDAETAMRALHRFGLRGREELPTRVLSAGQRRRVLLSRTLTRPAKVWILDEPLTALDVTAVADFSKLVADHLRKGGIAVVTSHQPLPLGNGEEVVL